MDPTARARLIIDKSGLSNAPPCRVSRTDAALVLLRELQREKVWSRIHLVPLLLAEGDRDAYRRQQAALEREKEIMKDVPGWEVSEFSNGTMTECSCSLMMTSCVAAGVPCGRCWMGNGDGDRRGRVYTTIRAIGRARRQSWLYDHGSRLSMYDHLVSRSNQRPRVMHLCSFLSFFPSFIHGG